MRLSRRSGLAAASRRSGLAAAGFLAGLAAGTLVWSRVRWQYRRQLFSTRPLARFAALTYLASRPTIETAHLLGDYVRWEPKGALRRHGERVLRRVWSHLQ